MRHHLIVDEFGERLVLPYRRRPTAWVDRIFAAAFLGIAALVTWYNIRVSPHRLGMNEIGLLAALLCWLVIATGQKFGRETIRVRRGHLEVSRSIGPLRRTWRFPVAAIRGLTALEAPDSFLIDRWKHVRNQWPWARPRDGAAKFDCGGRSYYLAEGADPPEDQAIATWLARRLPPRATEWEAKGC